jgi:glycosyltransferase involved in cell wall biosynthesis
VLCAGAPDTPEIAEECKNLIAKAKEKRSGIIWIQEMLPHTELRVLYSHAAVFATPSLYEPFGIINLEAMACGTPVVGSEVGGIPEIIVEGGTGFLVPLPHKSETDFSPENPEKFQSDLAEKLNSLLTNPGLSKKMGEASRKRAETVFSWKSIARQTMDFYKELLLHQGDVCGFSSIDKV